LADSVHAKLGHQRIYQQENFENAKMICDSKVFSLDNDAAKKSFN